MQRCFKVLELYKSRQVFGSFYTLNWYFWFPLNSHCISIWFFFFLSIFLGDRNKMGLWKHTRTEEFILGDSTGVTVPFAFCMWYTAPDSCLVISSYRWWNRHSRMLSLLVVITRKCLQKKKKDSEQTGLINSVFLGGPMWNCTPEKGKVDSRCFSW